MLGLGYISKIDALMGQVGEGLLDSFELERMALQDAASSPREGDVVINARFRYVENPITSGLMIVQY
jgi:hypothetical protein